MRPLIGIPPVVDAAGRWRPGRDTHYIDGAYARAVEAAGGAAIYLPVLADGPALLVRVDGLLLPGGGDFEPPRPYPPGVRFDAVSRPQLDFDTRLLEAALAGSRPVLGICYGMQLLALHCGGRLVYDIATDLPGALPHRLGDGEGRHELRVEPGSRLAALLGSGPGPVNSRHHQGVAEPGRGLRVAATAADGVIEAIEACGPDAFCLGVQWHPESMDGPHRERLFAAFVAACAARP